MLTGDSGWRTSVQSLAALRSRGSSGFQRRVVALHGLPWREQPEDAQTKASQTATGDEGANTVS